MATPFLQSPCISSRPHLGTAKRGSRHIRIQSHGKEAWQHSALTKEVHHKLQEIFPMAVLSKTSRLSMGNDGG